MATTPTINEILDAIETCVVAAEARDPFADIRPRDVKRAVKAMLDSNIDDHAWRAAVKAYNNDI